MLPEAKTSFTTPPTTQRADLEITVAELYRRISQPNNFFLLDVRNDEEFNTWKVESRFTPETRHIFYGEIIEDETILDDRVPGDREVVVLCAKGGASDYVAGILREQYGIPAVNVVGGMIAWGNFYHIQPVIEAEAYQIYQVNRPARGCLSYILISQGQAVVIDPLREIQGYQDFLLERNSSLALILDTHAHADHISGGPALSEATGAPYYLHPYDGIHPFDMLPATIDFQMLFDGKNFLVGDLNIQTIHTPGHTLGQVNFLVTAGNGKSFLFSGDNLFIQSFGRPDLGGQGESWAPLVYQTIFEKIRRNVPLEALLLPGHFARHDEAGENGLFAKTMIDLWEENADLRVNNREEFVAFVLKHLPVMPPQYVDIKRVNAGLLTPDEQTASELELGKNICALSTAY
jgi:glyoxylase-like metal-dependent hydrolase (beta-lactamase superfamily II)/rhodanese-related sulfurtransferase